MKPRKRVPSPCDGCGKALTWKTGRMSVDLAAVARREDADREFEAKYTDAHGNLLVSGDAWDELPELVPWQWTCGDCSSNAGYWIEGTRIDTVRKALHWTLHLLHKIWFKHTDWDTAVRRLHEVGGA